MPAYDVFFFGALFFLAGVGLGSIGHAPLALITSLVATLIFFLRYCARNTPRYGVLALLAPFIALGLLYDARAMRALARERLAIKNARIVTGIVTRVREKDATVTLALRTTEPFRTNLLVTAPRYPEITPGDIITVEGVVAPIKDISEWQYLQNENASGRLNFPKLTFQKSKSTLQRTLYALRTWSTNTLSRLLPGERGELMNGLLFGGNTAFSKSLSDALKRSGTVHITALSGFNITVIMSAVVGGLIFLMRKKQAIFTGIGIVCLFVLMTGAAPSLVRAAIMGMLVVIAPLLGRIYHPRNAIILAALAMTLENPSVLTFDKGFQLSFLALIGIVYLKPILDRWIRNENTHTYLKDFFTTTLSAELLTAPALLGYFGAVPLVALLSNLVILPLVPVAMALGFGTLAVHVLPLLGTLVAWTATVPLALIIGLVEIFARAPGTIKLTLPAWLVGTLYVPLGVILWKHRNLQNRTRP